MTLKKGEMRGQLLSSNSPVSLSESIFQNAQPGFFIPTHSFREAFWFTLTVEGR